MEYILNLMDAATRPLSIPAKAANAKNLVLSNKDQKNPKPPSKVCEELDEKLKSLVKDAESKAKNKDQSMPEKVARLEKQMQDITKHIQDITKRQDMAERAQRRHNEEVLNRLDRISVGLGQTMKKTTRRKVKSKEEKEREANAYLMKKLNYKK